MSACWSGFACSNVTNRFNHHGIYLNNSEILLLGGINRKEEKCTPLILQLTNKSKFGTKKTNSTCLSKQKERRQHSTEKQKFLARRIDDFAINIVDNGALTFENDLNGIHRRNWRFAQRSCDQTFENQDLFPGIACTYDQLNKLLFLGGGYDTTKKEFSRQAQVFKYDGRIFQQAFEHICDLPTTASVGCSVSFNISMEEKAVYLFGGQEDWRYTDNEKWEDPKNNFSNRIFRLDLIKGSWKELITKSSKSNKRPSPRSQAFCFIRNEHFYVYGGYDGQNIFSDFYRLDLATLEWQLLESDISFRPKEYKGLLKPPDSAQPVNYKPLAAVTGRHLFVVGENFEVFHCDLATQIWNQLPSKLALSESKCNDMVESSKNNPKSIIAMERQRMAQHMKSRHGADLIIGDKSLFVIGGEDPNSNNEKLLVSYYNLRRKLDWSIERLLWLACFKNNVKSDECHLSQCPPMIIYKIISFVNSDIFIM